MPARPTITVTADVTYSWVEVTSAAASVGATGASQWVIGSHSGGHWIQPPTVASTARIPTGTSIVHAPSRPWWSW